MKPFKKISAIILAVAILVTLLPRDICRVYAKTQYFAGGDGTASSPYLIETKDHLNNIRKYPSAHYMQAADIEFSAEDYKAGGGFYNNGKGWTPVGTATTPFSGNYDGNGYSIYNLKIYLSGNASSFPTDSSGDDDWTGDYIIGGASVSTITPTVGLFGYNTGTIKNLAVEGRSVYARSTNSRPVYVGAITGYNTGTISSCYSYSSVSASSSEESYVGAITGYNKGTIVDCFALGNVSGQYAGGISGGMEGGVVSTCYSVSTLNGKSGIGGLAGKADNSSFENCYYIDSVSVGVGVGEDAGIKCTEQQLKEQSTFEGFNFDTTWTMEGRADFPYPQHKNNIMRFPKIISVSMGSMPEKREYIKNKEHLELSGAKIKIIYDNGLEKQMDITEDMISGFDNSALGECTVTVSFEGYTTSFTVNIVLGFTPGDVDGNGEIDIKDVVTLSKLAAGWQNVEHNIRAIDPNGDKKMDLSDAVHLARFLSNWEGVVLSEEIYS